MPGSNLFSYALGKRVLDIAVGGASNLHGNIGRHDAAFESVIPCDMVRRDIIVLAASAGGLDALRGIVRMLPTRFPAALFVVQHIGPNSSILPALLSQAGPLPASYPAHGQGIMPGHIYVAPPDHHMRLTPGLIHLDTGPKIHFTRPAADPLFQSAALAYGARVVGVVLSGDDGDGAAGLRDVKARGGISIVQEPNQAGNSRHAAASYKGGCSGLSSPDCRNWAGFGAAQLPQGHAVNVIFSNPSWCLEFLSPNFLRPSNTPLHRGSASYRQSSTC